MRKQLLILILVGVFLFVGCTREEKPKQAQTRPPAPVVFATAVQKEVPVLIRAIGRVEPSESVSIRPQVDGEIRQVHFQEGQKVRKGDLLFSIDQRSYEVSVDQAEARVHKEEAILKEFQGEAARKKSMLSRDFISRQDYDKILAQVGSQTATVKAAEADVEKAQLTLSFCTIRAPIAGRTGKILISRGNFVNTGGNPLVEIKQVQPAYVSFTVPGKHLPAIRRHMKERELEVAIALPGRDGRRLTGKLTFLDNNIDQATGTLLMKAVFANQEDILWAGQSVDAALRLTKIPDAVVVPSRAIQKGPEGYLVFVAKGDNVVEVRPVVPGLSTGEETQVEKGVNPGERVVIDGQLALYPGAAVVEKKAEPSAKGQEKETGREKTARDGRSPAAEPDSNAQKKKLKPTN